MLTEEQLQHYYREGYLVIPGLVPRESVKAVLEAAAPHAPKEGSSWRAQIFEHKNPEKEPGLHHLLVEPNILEAVEEIFGQPPRVYYGMLAVVPAHGGNGLPWHQDNQYNHVLPAALNTFVALSEITPDKAMLWVSPQSHRKGVQPSNENQTTAKGHREAVVEPTNGIQLPTMQPGDACIFDRSTYHRSLKNETDADRYAYAAQYITENGRYAATGEKNSLWIRAADLAERWRFSDLL